MLGRSRFALGLVVAASLAFACTKQQVTQPQPLAIQCSATPTSGQAPLNVAFGLNLANATGTVAVSISYGDGSQPVKVAVEEEQEGEQARHHQQAGDRHA